MSAAPKKKIDPYRRSLYGKIEVAKKALGLDDDTYRDIVEQQFNKRSRINLSNTQLVDLIEHFKTLGFKPKRKPPARAGQEKLADGRSHKKIRALWISLYNLGIVRDPSEAALGNYVKRMAKVDNLQWLKSDAAFSVIEALKSWASREGGVNWEGYRTAVNVEYRPRLRVIEAQWSALHKLGVAKLDNFSAVSAYLGYALELKRELNLFNLTDEESDRAIEILGKRLRGAKAKASKKTGAPL